MNKVLRSLADIYYGQSPNRIRLENSEYPIFGTGGQVGYAIRPLFEGPAIIVGRKGTLGNPIYTPINFWAIDTTYAVKPKVGIDAKWLYYHLLNFDLTKLNEATGVPSINREYLYQVNINYCTLDEQSKIAEILTTVDDAIEQTETVIQKYQRIKQGLMQDLFTKGINPRRSLTSTELGTIPNEWKISQMKKITNVRRGASPRPIDDPRYFNDTGRGWVRISDVTSTYKYLRTTSQYLSNLGSSLSVKVNPGDLIMSICASIGKPIILDIPACIHDGFVLFQDIHPDFDPEFLFYFLDYRSQFIKGMNQTGTQGNLNTGIVNSIFVPQPQLEEQKEINSVLSTIDKSIEIETQKRNKLAESNKVSCKTCLLEKCG